VFYITYTYAPSYGLAYRTEITVEALTPIDASKSTWREYSSLCANAIRRDIAAAV